MSQVPEDTGNRLRVLGLLEFARVAACVDRRTACSTPGEDCRATEAMLR